MSEELVVSTRQGRLIGIKNRTAFYGTHYYSFSGIPYAQPPVKSLQFRVGFKQMNFSFLCNDDVNTQGGSVLYFEM